MTLRSWYQMNRNGHSSPVKHKVEGKPHKMLEKLKITSGKSIIFWHFFVKYFRSPVLTSEFLLIKIIIPLYFIHVCLRVDLVFALLLAIRWLNFFGGVVRVKKQKTIGSSWFHRKLNFLEKSIFVHFYDSIGYIKKK